MGRAEAQAAAAQEGLTRCRKELEETRKREVRLRDKLKEYLDTDGKGPGPGGRKVEEALLRIEQLEREVEVLRTQNLILRKSAATGGGDGDGDGDVYGRDPGERPSRISCCSHNRSFWLNPINRPVCIISRSCLQYPASLPEYLSHPV